uniref:Homocysteine S-methyltransferase n=1 Tax=Cacopsylla melanoneura TaxID=428564 RepID=A0A8D8SMK6_9HEMI
MKSVKLIDGGFASQLSNYVGDVIDGHPLWSSYFLATGREAVVQTHRDFIRAGADIVMTNSYQASVGGFMEYLNMDYDSSYELIKQSVEYVKEAIELESRNTNVQNKDILIAGSVGPYGASLRDGSEYRGDYAETVSESTMADWHRPRIQALVEAGADIVAIETVPASKEARMLCRLLREWPNQKAWLSFSCKDEKHISNGELFTSVARSCYNLNPDQILAVGINCIRPLMVSPLISQLNTEHIPLVVYPNSGERWDAVNARWIDRDLCEPVDKYITDWLNQGVLYVGGCCRTYAEDTKHMRYKVDEWVKTNRHRRDEN